MLRAKLTIAGSNFIFSHINENYNEYLSKEKNLELFLEVSMWIILTQKIFQF